MKFYVASSFKNVDTVRLISEKLIHKGYIRTYDWTQNERDLTIEQLKELGQAILNSGLRWDLAKKYIFTLPTTKLTIGLPRALFIIWRKSKHVPERLWSWWILLRLPCVPARRCTEPGKSTLALK